VEPSENIRPLKDVWLRPRRVFRALSTQPVGLVDYLLAATIGIGNFLALYRPQGAEAHAPVLEIVVQSVAYGAIAGIVGTLLMGLIYTRLSARAGGRATVPQVIHVLAYGNVPTAAAAGLWILSALLIGEAAFIDTPKTEVEGFPAFLVFVQVAVYLLLTLWSVVLQVMGLSEVQGFLVRKAFGVWVLGQLIWVLASLFLVQLLQLLFAGVLPHIAPDR
jgi:hypothetical protein